PPHPSQKPKDGWLDVGWVIQTVRQANPNCHFTLEHVHTEREDAYLKENNKTYEKYMLESIEWVQSFLSMSTQSISVFFPWMVKQTNENCFCFRLSVGEPGFSKTVVSLISICGS